MNSVYTFAIDNKSINTIPGFTEIITTKPSDRKQLASTLNIKCFQWNYKDKKTYTMMKYDKKWLPTLGYSTMGMLRSVITDNDGRVLCYAPPKSMNEDSLLQTFTNSTDTNSTDTNTPVNSSLDKDNKSMYNVEEFVDGTMINAFYDTELQKWQIATRSSVGAEISFYMETGFKQEDTFSYMFFDICNHIQFDINTLKKEYIYSFVMQHPSNRIVKPIREKALYLVEVYEINNKDVMNQLVRTIPQVIHDTVMKHPQLKYPQLYAFQLHEDNYYEKMKELKSIYASNNTRYDIVGLFIKDNRGNRYKIRNSNYDYVKKLRGNNPKLQFQYLHLRNNRLVTQYLMYYPEHTELFEGYQRILHDYTKGLYENYVSCFIFKEKPITDYPEKYRNMMKDVHRDIYQNLLRDTKERMNMNHVIDYINTIPAAKLMFLSNYDIRRHTIQDDVYKHKAIVDNAGVMPNSIDTTLIDDQLKPISQSYTD